MATVTGYTAARMKEIEDSAIIDGDVVGNNLLLTRYDGTQINAGNVRGPQGPDGYPGDASLQVVTSLTRPESPTVGLMIYETDTHRLYTWNGTVWIYRGGMIVCTAATHPASPLVGMMIYETDTNRIYGWNGTAWIYRGGMIICTAATHPSTPFSGMAIYETDTDRIYIWNGSVWVYRGGMILCTAATHPANPFVGLMIYETDLEKVLVYNGFIWKSISGGIAVCTSSTRPSNPTIGMMIYETDTHKIYTWNGTIWTLPKNVPGGILGIAKAIVNQNGVGVTLTDLTSLSLTLTIAAGRYTKISGEGIFDTGSGSGGYCIITVDGVHYQRIANWFGATTKCFGSTVDVITPGLHTIKLRMAANDGSVNLIAGPSWPAQLVVEDIGAI